MTGVPEKLPIRMLNDRLLVCIAQGESERRSVRGVVIPTAAQVAATRIKTSVGLYS